MRGYGANVKIGHSGARQPRGFTLLELAIVIGVIGIIVSALFAFGPTAQYHVELNRAIDETAAIRDNMHALYASRSVASVASQAFAPTFDQQLASQGVFPQDMLSNGYAYHPWDQATAGGSVQIALQAGSPALFILRFLNIVADTCTDLVTRNSMPGPETGLQQIVVTGGGTTAFTDALKQLPVSPTAATAACRTGNTYTIDWYYTLGS